jgi:hypothetical protein
MSEAEIESCVEHGEIVWLRDCGKYYACYSRKSRKTPRAQTLEKAHIQRANISVDPNHYAGKSLVDMIKEVEEETASRAVEEKTRIEEYHRIELETRSKLIVQVPADIYDRDMRANAGIPAVSNLSGEDSERTPGGIGKDVLLAEQEEPNGHSTE